MKIAFIGFRNIGYHGGVSTYIREIAPVLIDRGHEILAYTLNGYENTADPRVQIHTNRSIRDGRLEMLLHGFQASMHVMFQRVDVVHYHSCIAGAAALFPALSGKPRVLTIHGNGRLSRDWDRFSLCSPGS